MQTVKQHFDVIVVGGGPAGATAANELAQAGINVALIDKPGKIKPCGGAVPPRLINDFAIPNELIEARAACARMISPKNAKVDMPIDNGYVGMVNREHFDEWLRVRAEKNGATRFNGKFLAVDDATDTCTLTYQPYDSTNKKTAAPVELTTNYVIGADGANSSVGKKRIKGSDSIPFVSAYHEIVQSPKPTTNPNADFDPARCDVYYQGKVSPDFYGWVFPHGDVTSVGVGSAVKGFKLRSAATRLREASGLSNAETVRCEGAPIPLKVLKRWDNGRNIILAGDAAGVVAPASGEGIYYAMRCGQLVANAVETCLQEQNPKALKNARKQFMRECGKVFLVLGIMQKFWYRSDKLREKFVHICRDKDVQKLTWESYMHKKLVRKDPIAHVRIFFKDLAHLCGLAQVK